MHTQLIEVMKVLGMGLGVEWEKAPAKTKKTIHIDDLSPEMLTQMGVPVREKD